jgi:type II secretory pathway component PulJ
MQIDANPIRVAKRLNRIQKLRDRMFLIRRDLDQLTKRTR